MTKEDGVPKYNEILFSHKKGNDAIYTNTGPRDYHPEWSKSEKQIPYDIAYTWNLKKKGKMSLFTKHKQSHRHWKQSYSY